MQAQGLRLILDAAHMAGTRVNSTTPGLGADAIVYSFQAVKNSPTADREWFASVRLRLIRLSGSNLG